MDALCDVVHKEISIFSIQEQRRAPCGRCMFINASMNSGNMKLTHLASSIPSKELFEAYYMQKSPNNPLKESIRITRRVTLVVSKYRTILITKKRCRQATAPMSCSTHIWLLMKIIAASKVFALKLQQSRSPNDLSFTLLHTSSDRQLHLLILPHFACRVSDKRYFKIAFHRA